MLDIGFFLDLAIILLATKLLGIFTRKVAVPAVVGALLAGLILGPSMLNVLHESDFMVKMAEIGVILLMFTAGMETDLKELRKSGLASLVVAVCGVLVPLVGGFLVSAAFNGGLAGLDKIGILRHVFVGVVLTATSVSITVETLRELGKLRSKTGTTILGAAVIDDVLGIVVLTIVTGMSDPTVQLSMVFFKIIAFFVFAALAGVGFYYLFRFLSNRYGHKRRVPIYGLAFCFLMAYVAEVFFGIADITGAYLAGIIISNTRDSDYVMSKVDVASYMLFSPIFFASIGIKTDLHGLGMQMIWFALALLIVAIISKIIGCGLGARLCGFRTMGALKVGAGMVSRGEVALIVAQKGVQSNLLSTTMFAPIILVVIVTTLITPVLLKIVYSKRWKANQMLEAAEQAQQSIQESMETMSD
jgi:Kef-type K+ transport system membrane component KefB